VIAVRTLFVVLAVPAGALAAQMPPNPPAPAKLGPAHYPAAQEALLPNGLRLAVLENHRQPIVSITLSLPAGTATDPAGQEGTADMMAALLTRGAGSRTTAQVADQMEQIGGSLSASATPDFLTLQADVVSRHIATALGLIADAVLRPRLDSADIEGQRAQMLTGLETELGSQGGVTGRIFLVAMYGKHPYGSRPTPPTVRAISRARLAAFRAARFRPAGSMLVVSGDITAMEARRLVTTAFAGWTGLRPAPIPAPPAAKGGTTLLLVHNPGAPRANILFGNSGMTGSDTTLYPALVAARILGDPTAGRLTRLFAETRRWTDVTFASLLRTQQMGLFQAGVEVPEEVADSALVGLLVTLQGLRTDLVPADELDEAKRTIADGFPFTVQTAAQLAAAFTEARQLGQAATFVNTFRQRVSAVTAARVREAAQRLIRPDSGLIVVVGDGARLYRRLSALGRVQLVGLDGQPLKPEEIEAHDTPLALDPSRMTARRDTLLVIGQDRVIGRQIYALEPTAGGFVYVERTDIGQAISQVTRVELDSAGRVRKVEQTGKIRGQDTKIDLAYAEGRVKGTARVIGQDGPATIQIDTTVDAGVIDDNAIQGLLPFLAWAPNVRWTLQAFSAGENRVKPLTLTVVSREPVPVGNGQADAWKAVLEGTEQRVTFYVGADAPHKILRVSLANAPIEFVAQTP
jgi:zinc protease